MTPRQFGLNLLALLALLVFICNQASSAELAREGLAQYVRAPLIVGERDAKYPVWPILIGGTGGKRLAGWAFQTHDFAKIPGFSGTPPNMYVLLKPDGTFLDVKVISHHEPVFLAGVGEEPLLKFVTQYEGKTLGKPVKVGSNINSGEKTTSSAVYIDGVAKATASVLIINQAILAAAIKVARGKLGMGAAGGASAERITDNYSEQSWADLVASGQMTRTVLSNADYEQAYKGGRGEELDEIALERPNEAFAEVFVGDALVPSVGRQLFGERVFKVLSEEAVDGHHMVLLMSTGRFSLQGESWTPGSVPDRVLISQGGFPIPVRDMAFERPIRLNGVPEAEITLLKIPAQAGFNPADPFDIVLHVTREKGQFYPELISKDFPLRVTWPQSNYIRAAEPVDPGPPWMEAWRLRIADLVIIAITCLLLLGALIWQRWTAASEARLRIFRLAFLAFTLLFIGWYAQAQLSIVTLIGVIKATYESGDFNFLLWDPPSLVLWGLTLVTLVIWGRGFFCGWLCPFGALQEFAAEAAKILRIKQLRVPAKLDENLRLLKYTVLVTIVGLSFQSSTAAETFAEIEPFKTAITVVFDRYWPYVLYAIALIALNLFIYKAFCRYLCPLGAALAVGGKLRILDWIPRRTECGTPCQFCKVKCRYGAIEPGGKIAYDECFQCLDCVQIHDDKNACVPLVLKVRRGRQLQAEAAE